MNFSMWSHLNESTQFDVLPTVDCDKILDIDTIEACHESDAIEMAARVCYESTVNFNRLAKAVVLDEFATMCESGTVVVTEGAKIDAFIEKAKAFFKNLWEKIQGIFKKVAMQFNGWFQSDKDFIKKYKKDINTAINKGLGDKEVKIYKYVFLDQTNQFASMATKTNIDGFAFSAIDLDAEATDINAAKTTKAKFTAENKKDTLNNLRGQFVDGSDDSVEAGEFVSKLKEKLQGDSTKTGVKVKDAVSDAMKFLEGSTNVKKVINDGLKEAKKSIDDAITGLDKIKKTLNKDVSKENGELAGDRKSVV